MAKNKNSISRRGLITTIEFISTLESMGIYCEKNKTGYKLVNCKSKKYSNIHSHKNKHELNPSVIKKTVTYLGLSIDDFNQRVFGL